MAQYHALGLLYHIKSKDRLAVQKLVATQTRKHLSSPFASCLLIRYAVKVMDQDPDAEHADMQDFLEACLRNKHEVRARPRWTDMRVSPSPRWLLIDPCYRVLMLLAPPLDGGV